MKKSYLSLGKVTILTMIFILLFGSLFPYNINHGQLAHVAHATEKLDIQEDNLFLNGDFEDGTLTDWDTSGNSKFEATDEASYSGDFSLKISGPQEWNGIKYTVEVDPNTDYELTFYGKGSGGAAYKVLESPNEAEITEDYTGHEEDWVQYQVEFNSGENTSVIVYVSDAEEVAYYDQFVLVRADGSEQPIQESPILSDVQISGAPIVYNSLTVQYEYEHPEDIEEGQHEYRWYYSDAEDGNFQPIDRAVDDELTVMNSLIDKYVKVAMHPVDQRGVSGELSWSKAVGPIMSADILDDLSFEIDQAEAILAQSEKGDAIGQYPEAVWNVFEAVIDEANQLLNTDDASEEDINHQIGVLKAAVEQFDKGRMTIDSPSFDHFITAEGSKLMDGQEELEFISYNVPGALFNENEPDENDYDGIFPNEFELRDIFETINQVNGKVIRTYTLSILKGDAPAGTERHIMGPNTFSEEAFKSMDLLLKLANEYDVRVIIPFIDHWDYTMGGIGDFASFRNKNSADFYTDPVLMEDFKQVMDYVMNRVNTYTGVRYKDDPAILGWETGNELNLAPEWMTEIASHYKSINSNQLLISGNQMGPNHHYENISEAALNDPNIDVVKSHYYLGNYVNNIKSDLEKVAGQKPFFIGEFGFKPTNEVEDMLDEVINSSVSGALIWSLRPHSRNGGFVQHSEMVVDGILYRSYHWPGMPSGDSFDATNLMHVMRDKAYEIQGESAPELPAPTPAPHLFEVDSISALRWRGSTGASSYTIERSENPEGDDWIEVGTEVLDDVAPGSVMFADPMAETGTSYFYRVKGVNTGGETDYSNVIGPIEAAYYLEDTLEDDSQIYYSTDQSIVYRTPSQILNVEVEATQLTDDQFSFYVSNDGLHFEEVDFNHHGEVYQSGDIAALDADYLKIVYPDENLDNGRINRVKIEYLGDGSVLYPTQPLIRSGILIDKYDDFSNMFNHSDNLAFDTTSVDLAGGDESRLIKTDENEATIEYRSLGEMNSIKLETYQQETTQSNQSIEIYGSNNGVDYTILDDVEIVELGGTWKKINYEVRDINDSINFIKIVIPEGSNTSPQISQLQIGVGSEEIRFAEDLPPHIVENGETYGGENLLLQNGYEVTQGQVDLELNQDIKNNGDYSVKANYQVNDKSISTIKKSLPVDDRAMYDTLQMWLATEQDLTLTVNLGTLDYGNWSYAFDVQSNEGTYVNIPLYEMLPEEGIAGNIPREQINEFELTIADSTNESGTIYIDDVHFIQTRIIDNFDHYENETDFYDRYNESNPEGMVQAALNDEVKEKGTHSLELDVNLRDGYAGLISYLPHVDWTPFDKIRLWVDPNGLEIGLGLQVRTAGGEYMEVFKDIDANAEPHEVIYEFDEFDYPDWYGGSGTLDPNEVVEFNIYINQNGSDTTGTIYIDEIELLSERVFEDPVMTPEDDEDEGDDDDLDGIEDDSEDSAEEDNGGEDSVGEDEDDGAPAGEGGDNEDTAGENEDNKDPVVNDEDEERLLPGTATSIYLYLMIGFALALLGGFLLKFRRKRI
ncbi:carbohydrate binding domain-containing protein [Amphibacillus sp. Q70]|uniref:carbohydrate binding domain-containing protein n=1 Tax=Amphibacillus sp. Q70 TaxID=3453416 RepID=UPI003F82BA46